MRRLLYAMLHLSRPLLASAGVCFVLGVVPVTVLTQTSRTVMGTVTDDTGTGLPGVTVLQQGTTYGLTPRRGLLHHGFLPAHPHHSRRAEPTLRYRPER